MLFHVVIDTYIVHKTNVHLKNEKIKIKYPLPGCYNAVSKEHEFFPLWKKKDLTQLFPPNMLVMYFNALE